MAWMKRILDLLWIFTLSLLSSLHLSFIPLSYDKVPGITWLLPYDTTYHLLRSRPLTCINHQLALVACASVLPTFKNPPTPRSSYLLFPAEQNLHS